MASRKLRDASGVGLIGVHVVIELTRAQKVAIAVSVVGIVGLVSLRNVLDRIFRASLPGGIAPQNLYLALSVVGIAMYWLLPFLFRLSPGSRLRATLTPTASGRLQPSEVLLKQVRYL